MVCICMTLPWSTDQMTPQKLHILTPITLPHPITALAASPNGLYLASVQKGDIKIWSVEKNRVLWTYTPPLTEVTITHLTFSPTGNLLPWTDAEGLFSHWLSPIPSNTPDPMKTPLSLSLSKVNPIEGCLTSLVIKGYHFTDTSSTIWHL